MGKKRLEQFEEVLERFTYRNQGMMWASIIYNAYTFNARKSRKITSLGIQ